MKRIFHIFICAVLMTVAAAPKAEAARFFMTRDMNRLISAISSNVQKLSIIATTITKVAAVNTVIRNIGAMGGKGQYETALREINTLNTVLVNAQESFWGSVDAVSDVATEGSEEIADSAASLGSGIFGGGSFSSEEEANDYAEQKKESEAFPEGRDYPDRKKQLELLVKDRNSYLAQMEGKFFITKAGYTEADISRVQNTRVEALRETAASAYTLATAVVVRQEQKLNNVDIPKPGNIRQQVIMGTGTLLEDMVDRVELYTLKVADFYIDIYDCINKAPIEKIAQ